MSNYDRGIYEPSDEVRVFDGAEEDDDVEGSRLPLLIVLALLVLAMFAGVVWLAYTQGVARGRGETPVLTAAAGPERVAPPGGGASGTVPYQGFKIYEQPAPPDDEVDNAPKPPPAAAVPKPAPVAQAPAAPKPAPAAAPPAPAPAAMTAPPKPTPAPAAAKPPAPAPKSVASLIQQANTAPPAAKPAPAPKPAASPPAMKQAVVPPPTATGAPRQLGLTATPPPAAAKPAPAVPASAPAKSAVAGGYVLQIGSYKSQGDAEAAWKTYKGRHAALLSGYSENIQQADLGEKGTWYRLRIGGLGDREVALALCDRLKADGGVCILGH
jgi:hypothetical protein